MENFIGKLFGITIQSSNLVEVGTIIPFPPDILYVNEKDYNDLINAKTSEDLSLIINKLKIPIVKLNNK